MRLTDIAKFRLFPALFFHSWIFLSSSFAQWISVRLQPSLLSNPASSNLRLHSLLLFLPNSFIFIFLLLSWGPYNHPAQLLLFTDLRSKNFFSKVFAIFTHKSKSNITNRKRIFLRFPDLRFKNFFNKIFTSFTNRKWNYPNRK